MLVVATAGLFVLFGDHAGGRQGVDQKLTATANLRTSDGDNAGRATLTETPAGVLIRLRVERVSPGAHALHLHETGSCEAPTFESAGGHFNPGGAGHGFKSPEGGHAGDLPNIHVPGGGALEIEVLADGVTLGTGEGSLLDTDGTAVVIHAGADDYQTDPAGNAGDRIACGVIRR